MAQVNQIQELLLNVDKRSALDIPLIWSVTDSAGVESVQDLTGYTATGQIIDAENNNQTLATITVNITSPTNGAFQLFISGTTTAALTFNGDGIRWFVTFTDPLGEPFTPLRGPVRLVE